jgi:hypothetical protein
MNSTPIEFHKIWIDQSAATEGIRERFGLDDALNYLIGERLFSFLHAAERDHLFAAEVPAFIDEIRRLFTAQEIHDYLDHLERTRYLAPQDVDLDSGSPAPANFFRYRKMPKARRNDDRENRISEEIIVDAYGPEEQAMSWYYYLEDKIQFPFQAQCIASVPTSPLRKGDSVEIRKMVHEDNCSTDMLVMTRWNNRNIAVPLSQLKAIGVDESTTQAIEDWHYWVAQGNCF